MLNRLYAGIGARLAVVMAGELSLKREEGQTLVEYALIIFTVGIGVTLALTFLRDQLRDVFTSIGNQV